MNGSSPNPITQAITDFAAHNLTKVGVIGGAGYFASQLALAVIHKSLDGVLTAVGYLFLTMIPAGAAFRAKKTNDLVVSNAAAAAIERATIAQAITPNSVTATASSPVPAIQREIDKQVRATT